MSESDSTVINISYKRLFQVAVIAIAVIVVFMIFNSSGKGYSLQGNVVKSVGSVDGIQKASIVNGKQEINMDVLYSGWNPKIFALKRGVPVKWTINGKELTGCNSAVIVPDYGLNVQLNEGNNVVEFTPDKNGIVKWSCRMGMLKGTFIVSDNGEATQEQINSASQQAVGGSCGGSGGGCGCGGPR